MNDIPDDVLKRAADALRLRLPVLVPPHHVEVLAQAVLEAAGWTELDAIRGAHTVEKYWRKEAEGKLIAAQAECNRLNRQAAESLNAFNVMEANYERVKMERDKARAALAFLMTEVEGFVAVDGDRFEFAMRTAFERGNEEPTPEDEFDGFMQMVAEARRVLDKEAQ